MDEKTFLAAVKFAADRGEYVAIGGGEPTIHPKFWQFLGIALGECEYVWLATNGKETRTALALAGLAKGSERLSVALSQDDWHEPINPIVVDAFRKAGLELRNVGKNDSPMAQGRAKTWGREGCVCSTMIVRPDGAIKPCGCTSSPVIGDVFNHIRLGYLNILESDEFRDSECWTSYKKKGCKP